MAETVNGYVPECRPAGADLSPQNRIYHRTARPVFLFYEYLVPPTALSEIVPFIGKTALEQGPW